MTVQASKTGLTADPGRVADLTRAIAEGSLSPIDLLEKCLARIADVDGEVKAWRMLDIDRALALAAERAAEAKAGKLRGPLHGLPVAVKDIIDVEGLTTLCNSKSRAKAAPAEADACVVADLRAAGAIPIGKTHTTEFAFFDPSPACNPHNTAHTPGGSSSGSAAAVAAGMVPAALGTQTVASVSRPAAYCGIGAFKPSTGSMAGFGVAPLAPVFDTVGWFGHQVEDALDLFEALGPAFLRSGAAPDPLRIVIPQDEHLSDCAPDMQAALERLADALAQDGVPVERVAAPVSFRRLFELQQTMLFYEMARALGHLAREPEGTVGAKLIEGIAKGRVISPDAYLDARRAAASASATVLAALGGAAVLWPATPQPAPEGLGWTGDARYIAPWTMIGGPIVSIPAGKAGNGLPLGCLLTSAPGTDSTLAGRARRLAPLARSLF